MKKGIAAPVTDAGKRRTREPLNWVFDEESGKLSISGQGPIPDYTRENPPAWYDFRTEIRYVNIDEGVTRVGSMAFAGCANLEIAVLSYSVERIGEQSFSGCQALWQVLTPRLLHHERLEPATQNNRDERLKVSVRALENTPFGRKTFGEFCICGSMLVEYFGSAAEVIIPEGVREIGYMAFSDKPIISVTFPESLEAIHGFAFRGTNLREIVLPQGIKKVEEYAFSGCRELRRVLLRDTNADIHPTAFISSPVNVHFQTCKRNRLPAVNQLGAGSPIGDTGISRLIFKDREGVLAASKKYSIKSDFRSLLSEGYIIFRVEVDHSQKRVRRVLGFALDSRRMLVCHSQVPCKVDGVISPYSDTISYLGKSEMAHLKTAGIRSSKKHRFQWYIAPHEHGGEYFQTFHALVAFLRENPEYSVESL